MTFSSALFLLVLGLLRGNDEGWGSTLIVSLLAGAGVLMAAFLAIETRVKEPMLPLQLFRKPAFTGVQLAAARRLGLDVRAVPVPDALPAGLPRHDPLEAGLRYLPLTVTNFFVAAATGALLSRVPGAVPDRRAASAHGPGPAADGRHRRRPTTGPPCCPASSWPAPASA